MAALRREVVGLYRRILRVSQVWQAEVPRETAGEREYIKNQARSLFRKNREVGIFFLFSVEYLCLYWVLVVQIRDESNIRLCLAEANARLEMGLF